MSVMGNAAKKVGNLIKSGDYFGIPITLNFKGERSYKTLCGGLTTLILSIFIVIYVT